MSDFFQDAPRLGNQFLEDEGLKSYLSVLMGEQLNFFKPDLTKFGLRVVEDLMPHHKNCELFPPIFEQYSAWGERIDIIHTHPSWSYMHKVSAEEGIVSLGYSEFEFNRTIQFAKLYLFNPSAGLYTCPLAMTDGAAYLIKHKLVKDNETESVYNHLTSQNPNFFWTSGQWMTEKRGGSDVSSSTETTARLIEGDKYALNGYKWFTSATTSQVTFTLAKIDGKVSLFLVNTQENKKNLLVVRLKEKLGTRQLPTAEIVLKDCIGKLVSPVGEGIKFISNIMNITRLYNSVCAVSSMRRALAIARDFAHRRVAFSKKLADHILHKETLFAMEVKVRAGVIWVLYMGRLLENSEKGRAEDWEKYLLRLMTPVIKLYTGKMSSEVVKEGMECVGGVGYMENSGLPNLLRDTEVFSIWEGTTNVLTLDMARVLKGYQDLDLKLFKYALFKVCSSHEFDSRINIVSSVLKSGKNLRRAAFELGHIFVSALFRMVANLSGSALDWDICDYYKGNFEEKFVFYNDKTCETLASSLVNNVPTGISNIDSFNNPRFKI